MSERTITLAEVINKAISQNARSLYTMIPAKVVKWDAEKGRADCQILIKEITQGEDESREVNSWPVVPGVPVEFIGAGGFRLTCPISSGGGGAPATTGRLCFSHRSLDKWLTGDGTEVDPEFDHAHALADAVFVPGLRPFGNPWSSLPTDEMSIGSDSDGNGRIHFKAGEIDLGDGASKSVARVGDKVSLGLCSVVITSGAVSKVTINGTDLTIVPAEIDVDIKTGSDHVKAVD